MTTSDARETAEAMVDAGALAQHTPGPWRYALRGPKEHPADVIVILAPNEDADKPGVSYSGSEIAVAQLDWEPDARLIAAAPALLAACEAALNLLKLSGASSAADALRAAIARARGEAVQP